MLVSYIDLRTSPIAISVSFLQSSQNIHLLFVHFTEAQYGLFEHLPKQSNHARIIKLLKPHITTHIVRS